jgi:hypothetical protein
VLCSCCKYFGMLTWHSEGPRLRPRACAGNHPLGRSLSEQRTSFNDMPFPTAEPTFMLPVTRAVHFDQLEFLLTKDET